MTASPGPAAFVALVIVATVQAPWAVRAQDAPGARKASGARDGTLSGTVTDTTGFVLPGVTVEVRSTSGAGSVRRVPADSPARTAVTDAAGRFEIVALPPAHTT